MRNYQEQVWIVLSRSAISKWDDLPNQASSMIQAKKNQEDKWRMIINLAQHSQSGISLSLAQAPSKRNQAGSSKVLIQAISLSVTYLASSEARQEILRHPDGAVSLSLAQWGQSKISLSATFGAKWDMLVSDANVSE